jgi:hypothetical protein
MNNSFPIDELINYSERPNAEDNLPQDNQLPSNNIDNLPEPPTPGNSDNNVSLSNMYSNIVQDLESSLNDVRNIRASNRASETSDILSSFSESLENIMNQSDTILRNLGGSMSMLPNYTEQNEGRRENRRSLVSVSTTKVSTYEAIHRKRPPPVVTLEL